MEVSLLLFVGAGVLVIAFYFLSQSKRKSPEKQTLLKVDKKEVTNEPLTPEVSEPLTPVQSEDIAPNISTPILKLEQTFLESGSYATQGRRPTMEDEHVHFDNLREKYFEKLEKSFENSSLGFYGIYDGHRGSRAAKFAEQNLVDNLICSNKFKEGLAEEALVEAFIKTDNQLLETARQENNWQDGSTAACALIVDTTVYVANLGDAEVIVGRLNTTTDQIEPVILTKLHKPTDPEERARIKSEGGIVFNGRISGTLAVSRAFGDLEFKTPLVDGDFRVGKLVSEIPYVNTFELDKNLDKFIIVGCDGVWERLSHSDSVKFVAENLTTHSVDSVCELLAKYAIEKGSMDNVSVIVIALHW